MENQKKRGEHASKRADLGAKSKTTNNQTILKDNLFKFWTSSQISKGTKLIIKQHGTNYGQIKDWENGHLLMLSWSKCLDF